MSLLPYLAITFGAGALSLLLATRRAASPAIGLLGLLGAVVGAVAVRPGDRLAVGTGELVASEYGRLVLVLAALAVLLLCLVGAASVWVRTIPGGALVALGGVGLAMASQEPVPALGAAIASGLAGVVLTLGVPGTPRQVEIALGEFRVVALAGALALVAAALTTAGGGGADPFGPQVAAVARFGAVPFHLRVARLPDTVPDVALPIIAAWTPATFAMVALGVRAWPLEQGAAQSTLLVALAAATILFGGVAAWIQDDLGHLVAYTVVQDAAFGLLGYAGGDAATAAALTWLVILAVAKTALFAIVAALRGAFGTRRIDELSGWARRSPGLAVALGLVVLATLGLPGLPAWEVRLALVDGAIGRPLGSIVWLAGLAALLAYGRVVGVGLRAPGPAVLAGADERPRRPHRAIRPMTAGLETEGGGSRMDRARRLALDTWRLNRAPIAAGLVLVLAGLSVAVSVGVLPLRDAAAAAAARPGAPGVAPTSLPPNPAPPSFVPLPSP